MSKKTLPFRRRTCLFCLWPSMVQNLKPKEISHIVHWTMQLQCHTGDRADFCAISIRKTYRTKDSCTDEDGTNFPSCGLFTAVFSNTATCRLCTLPAKLWSTTPTTSRHLGAL